MGLLGEGSFAFENYGGSYQLRIQSADDLAALDKLEEPFWIATSAPIDQLSCDSALLERLDSNDNGRIQSEDIRQAARWLLSMLRDGTGATSASDTLDLSAIDDSHAAGKRLLDTARRVLQNLGHADATQLTLAQVRDRKTIFAQGMHNGDGVIPAEGMQEGRLRTLVEDIMATVGSVADVNESQGVDRALLDTFVSDAKALLAWHDQADPAALERALLPFGAETAAQYALFKELALPIGRYFEACRVVALNEMLGRPAEAEPCPAAVFTESEEAERYLATAPLARPRPDETLPLRDGVNPHYRDALARLSDKVVMPILGERFDASQLRAAQWQAVQDAFRPYEEWCDAKRGVEVESLGLERLREIVDSDLPNELAELIEADLGAGRELEALKDLEYLILLQRWLISLCNNFVSFPYLYNPGSRAMFEAGKVIMGGQVLNLNLRLLDPNAHSTAAERSGIYLLYSEVTRGPDERPFFIVTPITGGRLANLGVGKRGVLFDPAGREWDTRVVKVVENPVNLREAIAAPFKRIGAQISSTVERMTAGAEQQMQAQITQASTSIETGMKEGIAASGSTEQTPPAPPQPAQPKGASSGGMRDMVLAGGVAIAALGSSFAYIAKTLRDLAGNWWIIPVVISVGLALVLVPTILIAFFRLRRRNLSALLEASGWAINAPMRLTRRLRKLIVQRPAHPKSIRRLRRDLTRTFVHAIRSETTDKS